MKPENLVGVREISERGGVAVITVQKWRERQVGFPNPVVTLAMGPVWDWRKVEPWIKARKEGKK